MPERLHSSVIVEHDSVIPSGFRAAALQFPNENPQYLMGNGLESHVPKGGSSGDVHAEWPVRTSCSVLLKRLNPASTMPLTQQAGASAE